MLDALKEHSDIEVERGVLPEKLEIDESKVDDNDAYPITVTLRHLSDEEATPAQAISGSKVQDGLFRSSIAKDDTDDLIRKGQEVPGSSEVVRAKYMIGCDGAHSWTRRQLGFTMEGEQTDYIWGVLDIIPITDFRKLPDPPFPPFHATFPNITPTADIRSRCAVHSAESGSLMVIPRENKLVRLYIQLTEVVKEGGQVDRSKITPEQILKAAQKTIAPYKLDYQYCDWWTAYQVSPTSLVRYPPQPLT
jgi:phenol 2-monooxygenase